MDSNNTVSEETPIRMVEDSEEEEEIEEDGGDWIEDDEENEDDGLESEYQSRVKFGFYGSFKVINYVRSQVAENRCWSCGLTYQSNLDLQNHLHETTNFEDVKLLWDDDKYLKSFMQEDMLLYSFGDDEEGEDGFDTSLDREEIMRDLGNFEDICIDDVATKEKLAWDTCSADKTGKEEVASTFNDHLNVASYSQKVIVNGMESREHIRALDKKLKDKDSRVSVVNLAAKNIKKINENHFGSYGSFGIHWEMVSDKVRTEAYRQAILENPSLMKGAVVMDVGYGTGILSLFAAQAGASRVIAVEASEKMAAVATQIAKDNSPWRNRSFSGCNDHSTGVIEVAQGMIEELGKSVQIQPHSIDVLVSEWMGYCLLYESMLSSVLFARDQWLKPGGAILPDTATMFVAGFGRSSTSLPFWENVCGFNMSCIGRELVQDAAGIPIVDVVDHHDLVTNAAVLQTFDLATMKPGEVDFTASVELEPKLGSSTSDSRELKSTTLCYGVVLWFETGFTSRFCKEKPVVLSTSPCTPKTHWTQTIITFREPIAMASGNFNANGPAVVGTDACPATRLHLRISIAHAAEHRSIDISLETAGVGPDGRKHSWPVQIFNLS